MASVIANKNIFGPEEVSIVTKGRWYTLHGVHGTGYDTAYEVETDRRIVEKVHSSYFDGMIKYATDEVCRPAHDGYCDRCGGNLIGLNKMPVCSAHKEKPVEYGEPNTRPKIVSDGGSSDYYKVYETDKDCQDIIERKKMGWNRANVFKAAFRMGEKEGPDDLYDWKKIKWFAEREIAMLEKKGK